MRCTCSHTRMQHRRGVGRCTVPGCSCLFAPPRVVRPAAEPRPGRRGTALADGIVVNLGPRPTGDSIREMLSERQKLERMLWNRIDDAGLPQPRKEYRFAIPLGRQFRADGFYEPDLLIEVDGGVFMPGGGRHTRGSGFSEDCVKTNLAAILGYRYLRFTRDMIKDGIAVDHIRRALKQRPTPAQLSLIGGTIADAQ
jgi:hypothetical protein